MNSVLDRTGFETSRALQKMLKALVAVSAIKSCGTGRATLLGFDSQPANPVGGDNVSLWVAYRFPSPAVTGGTATYSFSLNGIPFTPTVDPLCTQTTCPKEPDIEYNETSWSIFPTGVSGKIVSRILWADQDDAPLWCVETTWRV
jgi:hypothetical protein